MSPQRLFKCYFQQDFNRTFKIVTASERITTLPFDKILDILHVSVFFEIPALLTYLHNIEFISAHAKQGTVYSCRIFTYISYVGKYELTIL